MHHILLAPLALFSIRLHILSVMAPFIQSGDKSEAFLDYQEEILSSLAPSNVPFTV